MALLDAGLLVFSVIYYWDWYEKFHQPPKLERTLVFATLFLILYAVAPVLRTVKSSSVNELDFSLVLANSFAYFAALFGKGRFTSGVRCISWHPAISIRP